MLESHDYPTNWPRQFKQCVGNAGRKHFINIIFIFLKYNWQFSSNYHDLTQQRTEEEIFPFDYMYCCFP